MTQGALVDMLVLTRNPERTWVSLAVLGSRDPDLALWLGTDLALACLERACLGCASGVPGSHDTCASVARVIEQANLWRRTKSVEAMREWWLAWVLAQRPPWVPSPYSGGLYGVGCVMVILGEEATWKFVVEWIETRLRERG